MYENNPLNWSEWMPYPHVCQYGVYVLTGKYPAKDKRVTQAENPYTYV